ncbi:hypothetical protein ASPBRDRAFT_49790, partial [Aspergillus brasiliensis CBS 101740]
RKTGWYRYKLDYNKQPHTRGCKHGARALKPFQLIGPISATPKQRPSLKLQYHWILGFCHRQAGHFLSWSSALVG